ncbi:MAG: hypothetical protein HUU25_01815 [Candidatus Sumerlaeia bacterium]|nr:hypothetical protein [Candidatus Sumerlaeia bacterium]
MSTRAVSVALTLTVMIPCAMTQPSTDQPPFPLALSQAQEAWVQQTLAGLSLEERVGQMIFPAVPWDVRKHRREFERVAALAGTIGVGGFIVGGGTAAQRVPVINELQARSDLPLLICADFEAGVGLVWSDATPLPRAMAQAATGDPGAARLAGEITARESRLCGVHWPLVPICDVNINPDNPIINVRSYGEDVETVSRFAVAFTEGVQSAGAIACAKHFPGHGDTATDSHMTLAVVDAGRDRLESVEFPPFAAAIRGGVGSVMSSHIWLPALMEGEGQIPATVSRNVMTGLLRGEMGFGGLVTTDSMRMRGVTELYGPGEAAVRAVQAGVDCILVSQDDEAAWRAIIDAVRAGEIGEAAIARSVERVLRAKAWLGLHEGGTQIDVDAALAGLQSPAAMATARGLTRRSITVIRDHDSALPVDPAAHRRVLHLAIFDESPRWRPSSLEPFTETLARRFGQVRRQVVFLEPKESIVEEFEDIPWETTGEEIQRSWGLTPAVAERIREEAREADLIAITTHIRIAANKGSISLSEESVALVRELLALGRPAILVSFGSPYVLAELPEAAIMIATYDWSPLTCEAAAEAITGEFAVTGRLPVTLPGLAPRGAGLTIPARR